MKKVIIFIFIGIFMALISKYIFENFSPFNLTELQNFVQANKIKPGDWDTFNAQVALLIQSGKILKYLSSNAYILALTLLASIFSFFVAIHLVVDKIFFKNYYEKASMFDAVRRAILLALAIFLLVYLKLYGIDPLTLLLVPLLFLAIEIVFSVYIKHILVHRFNQMKEMHERVKQLESI